MEVVAITDHTRLNQFVGSQQRSQFLQSWEWGAFQQALGKRIWRIGVAVGSGFLGTALLIEQPLPLGRRYLYCPRGPIVDQRQPLATYQQAYHLLIREIERTGMERGALFIRLDPPFEDFTEKVFRSVADRYMFIKTKSIQPADTLILDLSLSENDLLDAMHPKTRYNIRLAEKHGVRTAEVPEAIETFLKLSRETTGRDGFSPHPPDYYRLMVKTIPRRMLTLFLAEYEGIPLVANLVMFFGDTTTYLHGASSSLHRNVMAPHLNQWAQILEAKKREYNYYDLWGVTLSGRPDHPWAGITRFKRGFGGSDINYIGTYDLILRQRWYTLYQLARKFV